VDGLHRSRLLHLRDFLRRCLCRIKLPFVLLLVAARGASSGLAGQDEDHGRGEGLVEGLAIEHHEMEERKSFSTLKWASPVQ